MTAIYMLFRALDKLSDFIIKLDETEKPSVRIKEYIEIQLPKLFSDGQIKPYKELEPSGSQ
jgi:hypothetical protein